MIGRYGHECRENTRACVNTSSLLHPVLPGRFEHTCSFVGVPLPDGPQLEWTNTHRSAPVQGQRRDRCSEDEQKNRRSRHNVDCASANRARGRGWRSVAITIQALQNSFRTFRPGHNELRRHCGGGARGRDYAEERGFRWRATDPKLPRARYTATSFT